MLVFLTILVLLACVILGGFILLQNPKGGGLSGTFGSMGTQMMGVKQSTDIMEKGTWTMIGTVALICIVSVMFFQKPAGESKTQQKAANTSKKK
jgi:preprotein translocase subunit SecG